MKILRHATLFVLALILPIHGHSWSELNDWLTDWDQRYETAWIAQADLTALELELEDMLARHPGWDGHLLDPPPPVTHAPTVSSASGGRGMGTGNVEQWRSLVAAYFPSDGVDRALCLMAHESGGNPDARNTSSGAAGLFQVMPFWWDHYGGDRYDPETNVRVASLIYAEQGWSAWAPYNRGLCR